MQRRGHHASGGSTSDQQNLQDTRAHQWTSQSQMSHNVNIDQHQRLTNTLHDSSLDQAFDFSASREERRRQGSVLSLTPSLRDGQIHFSTDGAWMSRTAVLPEGDLDLEPVTNEELEAFLSGNPWNTGANAEPTEAARTDDDSQTPHVDQRGPHEAFTASQLQPSPEHHRQHMPRPHGSSLEIAADPLAWTGFRDTASSTFPLGDMDLDVFESKSPPQSDPSLSPSSLYSQFSVGFPDANSARTFSLQLEQQQQRRSSHSRQAVSNDAQPGKSLGVASSVMGREESTSPLAHKGSPILSPEARSPSVHSHSSFSSFGPHHEKKERGASTSVPSFEARSSLQSAQSFRPPIDSLRTRKRDVRRTYAGSHATMRTGSTMRPSSSGGTISSAAPALGFTPARPRAETTASGSRIPNFAGNASQALNIDESNPFVQEALQKLRQVTSVQSLNYSQSGASDVSIEMLNDAPSSSEAFRRRDESEPNLVSGIPSSLSAELAGLGLDVKNLYGSNESDDVDMGETTSFSNVAIQQEHSSNSSETGLGNQGTSTGESSMASLTSSGLDDSMLSLGGSVANSRWIHGRDTPPSSPAPPRAAGKRANTARPLSAQIHNEGQSIPNYPMVSTSIPLNRSRSDINDFGVYLDPARAARQFDWNRTWPRATVSGQAQEPDYSQRTSREQVGNDPSSPSTMPRQTHTSSSASLRGSSGSRPQSSSSNSSSSSVLQDPRIALRPSSFSLSAGVAPRDRVISPSSSLAAAPSVSTMSSRSSQATTEGLSPDLGGRSVRSGPNLGRSSNLSLQAHTSAQRRLSGSVLAPKFLKGASYAETHLASSSDNMEADPFLDVSGVTTMEQAQRRRHGASGQQRQATSQTDQFDQVAAALDTLRTFMRQRAREREKSGVSPPSSNHVERLMARASSQQQLHPSPTYQQQVQLQQHEHHWVQRPSPSRRPQSMVVTTADAARLDEQMLLAQRSSEDMSVLGDASPSMPQLEPRRRLRHPPSGPLPPRGSVMASSSASSPLRISQDVTQGQLSSYTSTSSHSHSRPKGGSLSSHDLTTDDDRVVALTELAAKVNRMRGLTGLSLHQEEVEDEDEVL